MFDKHTLGQISKTILDEYNSGTMASERHLQAVIFNSIRPILSSKGLSLLIEPTIQTKKDCAITGIIPDMLIVNKNEVLAIIEIKYVPYGYPKFEKDFETFSAFHSQIKVDRNIYLKGQPKDGNWDTNVLFSIAQDLQTFYIAIARHDADIFTKTSSIIKNYLDKFEHYSFQPIFILINPDNDPTKSKIILDSGQYK
jgi:hypothetical protein